MRAQSSSGDDSHRVTAAIDTLRSSPDASKVYFRRQRSCMTILHGNLVRYLCVVATLHVVNSQQRCGTLAGLDLLNRQERTRQR